jgi:hypothetical protein
LPPPSLPKNSQLFRPTATPRMARSVALCRLPDYAARRFCGCSDLEDL